MRIFLACTLVFGCVGTIESVTASKRKGAKVSSGSGRTASTTKRQPAQTKALPGKKTSPVATQQPMLIVFTLPQLPYGYRALEPYVDAKTMEIHHTKHHQAYIDNLNAALTTHPELRGQTLEKLLTSLDALPEDVRDAVRNNAGGHYNHAMFWQCMMAPDRKGNGWDGGSDFAQALAKKFGSREEFKKKFTAAALSLFGSGWTWLCVDKKGVLTIETTKDQDCPISDGLKPLLCLDEWEHAYYLKYQNRRPDYITAWWNVVNWQYVQQLYDDAVSK